MAGFGLQGLLDRILGVDRPQPRDISIFEAAGPRVITGAGTSGVSSVPTTPIPNAAGAQQPQEDPLDRFERIARAMEIGERVGLGLTGGEPELLTGGGGVAHPNLPDPRSFGLQFLR